MLPYTLVVMTVPNKEEAEKIVHSLLHERLIACANITGPVYSLFWWKEKIDRANEFLVFMKSHEKFFERLCERVKEMHSYEVPEIIAIPITRGLPSYLDWLEASLQLDR